MRFALEVNSDLLGETEHQQRIAITEILRRVGLELGRGGQPSPIIDDNGLRCGEWTFEEGSK